MVISVTHKYLYGLNSVVAAVVVIHYNDVIMTTMASQITSLTIVYSTVYSDANQRKHQSSASLAFVRGIHRGPVNSPHKWPVTRKMLPFDDVIMSMCDLTCGTGITPLGPFYYSKRGASISNHIHYKVWDEITYPFPTVDVWEWISNQLSHFSGHRITYPFGS